MSERKYSIREIDDLRKTMENKYLYGAYNPQFAGSRTSRCYREDEKIKSVEEMVRTAMLAGHTADNYLERSR